MEPVKSLGKSWKWSQLKLSKTSCAAEQIQTSADFSSVESISVSKTYPKNEATWHQPFSDTARATIVDGCAKSIPNAWSIQIKVSSRIFKINGGTFINNFKYIFNLIIVFLFF